MPWDRVSQWQIEERRGGVLLTLRGGGAATQLVIPGWTLDDLELVMRNTAGAAGAGAPANATAPTAPAVPSRMERRRLVRPWRRAAWSRKVVATAVLLGLLATAVTLVLLQSAGVISWSFLGPTA